MNKCEPITDATEFAKSVLPSRDEKEPLFRLAWHARAFALIVTLVNEKKITWKSFQQRLVAKLKIEQDPQKQLSVEEIDIQYFDCWLEAVEETLLEDGFFLPDDVKNQEEKIKIAVHSIRREQLHNNLL